MHDPHNAPIATLAAALASLTPGDHLCLVGENETEPLAAAVPFVRLGLERGEKCIYVVEEGAEASVLGALIGGGIDVASALAAKRLLLTTPQAASLKGDAFDAYRMVMFWKQAGEEARRAGFAALRAIGDMGWLLAGGPDSQRWMAYEGRLTQLAQDLHCTFLCQYRRDRVPAELMPAIIRSHPVVVHRGSVCRNIYYACEEELARTAAVVRDTDRLLDTLRQHQQSVEELSRSEQHWQQELRLRPALAASAIPIGHTGSWAWDVAKREISFWSLEHYRIMGLDPVQGLPSYAQFAPMVHPDDLAFIEENFRRALAAQVAFDREYRIVRPDGSLRHVHAFGRPVFARDGTLTEYVGTILDITEQKQAEEALRQTQAELARVSRMTTLGDLTASIAHEVAQPLASMITDTAAALRWLTGGAGPDLDEVRLALLRIAASGRRAREVIERIRSLVKKTHSNKERLDVNAVIAEVISLTGDELKRNHIALRTQLDGTLPPVLADRVQIQQVLLNLIVNALEAINMRSEGAREVAIHTCREGPDRIHIAVRDSGVGLGPGDPQSVFDSFYTTKAHGMGVGLSISRTIVQAHGGTLWAARNEGDLGATFHLTLPVGKQDA